MGATNRITNHGRYYLALRSQTDPKKTWVFAEFNQKYPKLPLEAISLEHNKELEDFGMFEAEHHSIVGDGKIKLDL